MKKCWWWLRLQLQETGWQGTVGVVLMLGAILLVPIMLVPAVGEMERAQRDFERLQLESRRQHGRPLQSAPEDPLKVFYRSLPASSNVGQQIAAIFEAAEANGIALERVEYAMNHDAKTGLSRCQVILPLKASYTDIRLFMIELLNRMPALAVSELGFSRENVDSEQVDARLRLTIYLGREA